MYVVTGATGNTGRVIANRLIDAGKKVRVISRSADRLQPFVTRGAEAVAADLSDPSALTKAFTGATAVYAMIPPDMAAQDGRAYQERISHALAGALQTAGVKHAISLSSIGADKAAGTGPVAGLHEFENRLNGISGLNVVHLRPGYFMENTLGQAAVIRAIGKVAGPVRGDLKMPFIATDDIGEAAADLLLQLDFKGKQIRELQGQRDLSYDEVAAIIGKAIGDADLRYVHLPNEQVQPMLVQMGMSSNTADLILEMTGALNAGYMHALEPRSPQNTTETSYETFVAERFLPLYQGQSQAA